MKTIITTMAISGLALLTGCSSALKSNEVHAVNIPVAPYVKLSCNELVREQQLVIAHVQASGVAVDKEHNEDQAAEIVTWILFAPAAFFIEGNEQEVAHHASYKGQYNAISNAMAINNCGTQNLTVSYNQ
jgi:hypothetical protein